MEAHDNAPWQHSHTFGLDRKEDKEKRTRLVVVITLVTMCVELVAGYFTGSMALTADGWHMGTHAVALGMTAFAYAYARHHVHNQRFTFGTGKVGPLSGFASAMVLAVTALLIAAESLSRLITPETVHFDQAILVAVIGLVVNLACALVLGGDHDHGHAHGHAGHGEPGHHGSHEHPHGPTPHEAHAHHGHPHHDEEHAHHDHGDHGHPHPHMEKRHDHGGEREKHTDHNLRAAFLHVMADALTSMLAIFALISGKYFGWVWLDPAMGIVGSIIIAIWAKGLLRDTGRILLDSEVTDDKEKRIRETLEAEHDNQVADLHLWRVGPSSYACIVSLVTHTPHPSSHYKEILCSIPNLDHVTVEVNQCAQCGT